MVLAGAVRSNFGRLADYATWSGVDVRHYLKTTKSPQVSETQLQTGTVVIAAVKVSEAEAKSQSGDDRFRASPLFDSARSRRFAGSSIDRTVRTAINSVFAIATTAAAAREARVTIGLSVKPDRGLHRTCVPTSIESPELAKRIDGTPGIHRGWKSKYVRPVLSTIYVQCSGHAYRGRHSEILK